MKKIAICFLLLFTTISCTIKEKMVLNEDGSGTFSYGFDMSALMKMGKSTDTTKVSKIIDSVFTFKDIMAPMKDSISKLSDIEKEQFKLLEMFRIKLKVNEKQKEMSYDMEFDFPTTDSIKNMVSPTKAATFLSLSDKKIPKKGLKANGNDESNTSFGYDGKFFIKKVTSNVVNPTKKKTKVKKENKSEDEFSKKMEDMFKECKYSLEYHFPKKIKNISLKEAIISVDRKSFALDVPIENLKENMDLSFKVEFE